MTIRRILSISLLLAATFCSSGNNGASNPNSTTEEFSNPTGTLSDDNAKQVVYGGIYGASVSIFNGPRNLFEGITLEFDDCTTTSGDESTIDWDCVFNNVTQCTVTGETITTDDDGDEFITVDYQGFNLDCNGSDPESDIQIECEGTSNVARDNEDVYCSNLDCEFDGKRKNFDGCTNSDEQVLVRLSGDSFVVRTFDINDACTQITVTIRDKDSTKEVTCDITETDGSCDAINNIETISNCEIN